MRHLGVESAGIKRADFVESPHMQHSVGFVMCTEKDSGLISLGTKYILHERRDGRGEKFSILKAT